MGTINTNINVGFNIDKNGYSQLINSLQKVEKLANNTTNKNSISKEFQVASKAAQDLKSILNSSWDSKLNQINLTKLNAELKKSKTTAAEFYNKLAQGGQVGAQGADAFARSILNANTQLRQSNQLLDKMAVTFKNTVRYGISSSIFNTMTNSIQKAYNYTKNLDTSLNDIRIVSNQSAEEMERFAVAANKAAQALGKTTLDYTKAATIYFQQGLSQDEVERRTEITLKAANVTGQNAQDVSEQLTAVWNGYRIQGEELERYVDRLSAVAKNSASNLEELSTGMSKVASAAKEMGVDIDQLTAQMSTIISVTRQAPESVGTALRTIYARIADIKAGLDDETSLGNYTGKMAKLGINVLDASGNLREMGKVIEEVGTKWASMTDEQRISLAQTMAGTRQYNNLLTLFNNWDKYQKALEISKNSAGELQKQQDIFMESTEAHLQQLQAEAEKTYSILFDQKTIKSFADLLTKVVSTFNGYIKGIGGGGNAILNMGMQIANLYNKQIGSAIVRNVENVKSWISEIVNGGKQIEKLKESIRDSRKEQLEKQANIEEKPYMTDFAKAYQDNTNDQAEIIEQAWKVRKGLTNEQFKEIQNEAELVTQLKDEVALNEALVQYGKDTYDIGNSAEAKAAVDQQEKALNTSIEQKNKLIQLETQLNTLSDDSNQKEEVKTEIEKTQKDILENIRLNQGLLDDDRVRTAGELEEKLQREELTEVDIKDLKQMQNELIQEQNNNLKETKDIAEAVKQEEEGVTQQKRDQAELTKKSVKDKIGDANTRSNTASAVQVLTATVQGISAVTGALQTLGDEGSSAADKTNAAFAGISGATAAIFNAIAPGSGFIVMGLAQVGKDLLKISGLWEKWENSFKTSNELLEELTESAKKFTAAMKEQSNNVTTTEQNIKNLEEIKDRFEYLQNLAEKGLLPDDLRTEYESYLTKVQDYNDNIIISYDKQGKMITNNNNALDETIKKLKEQNEESKKNLYIGENWDKFKEQQENDYNGKKEAWNKYKDETQSELESLMKKKVSTGHRHSTTYHYLDKLGLSTDTWEEDIKDPEAWKEKALKALDNAGEESRYDEFVERIENYYKKLQDIRSKYDHKKAETIGSLAIDPNFLINNLATDPNQSKNYAELANKLGESNLNSILKGYLNGLDLSGDEFQKNGKLSLEKIRDTLREFNNSLLVLFTNSDNGEALQGFYKKIQELKNKTGEMTSQAYEEKMRQAIEDFLKTLTKEQFEEYKDKLAQMFGVDSVSAMWDEEKGYATLGKNGGNIVTSGEATARKAGRLIAETNVANEEDKEPVAREIESYLQNSFSEVDLSKLDLTKLSQDFNQLLYDAIQSGDKEIGIDKLLAKALSNQDVDFVQSEINKVISAEQTEIENFGLDTKELSSYSKYLTEIATKNKQLADSLEEDGESAVVVAKSVMRLNNGVKTLNTNFKEWNDVLKKSAKDSEEYFNALDSTKEAIADILDVEKKAVSNKFIETHLDDIAKAAEGNEKAIEKLRNEYADSILLDIMIKNEIDVDSQNALKQQLDNLQAEIPKIEVGTKIDVDSMNESEEKFMNACMSIVKNAKMTAEQAKEFFSSIGFDAEVETKSEPVEKTGYSTITATKMLGYDTFDTVDGDGNVKQVKIPSYETFTKPGTPYKYTDYVDVVAMSADGTPKIKEITKKGVGSMNNLSTQNPGGGSGKSGKSGSSAKAAKKDPNKDQLDRYQKVNVQLKEISKQLTSLDKQKNKLLGGDLVKNLNQQVDLLNRQIEVTEAKLKIAQDEQREVASDLSKYGISFDSDGNIANYAQIFKQEQDKLNAVYAAFNGMSKDAQEAYQDTVKAAEDSWKTFKDSISKYDNLIGDTIPQLYQDIQDAYDKQTENLIEQFNMEIKIRLDMSEATRDWNDFKRRIIDGIKDDDILGTTKAKIKDFFSYYNEEGTGEIQALTKHIQEQLEEIRKQEEENGGDWYRDNDAKAFEDLKEYYEKIKGPLTDIAELEEFVIQQFLASMDEAQEKFDEQIDTFENINKHLDHNIELINLLTDQDDYEKLAEQYAAQTKNRQDELDFYTQQKDFWANYLDTLEEGSEEWKNAKEKYNEAAEAWKGAITNTVQAARAEFENSIKSIFKTINNQLTNNKGLSYLNEEWELLGTNSELVLDNINKMQGFQELTKKYNDAINSTSNVTAQKKLAQLRDQELESLKAMGGLSEQDLERAEKKLEIVKAQIALEDAQRNKSQMRLRRDSQGNYRYQFVADEEEIQQAQQNLYAAYNELYNFDKSRYISNLNDAAQAWQEYQEKMAEAALINDPEKRAEKEALIKEQYDERIGILHEQLQRVMSELNQSTFAELNALYGENEANYELMTEEQKAALNDFNSANQTAFDLVFDLYTDNTEKFRNMAQDQINVIQKQMVPQWESGYQDLVNAIEGEGGIEQVSNRMMEEMQTAIDKYKESLGITGDAAGDTFDAITSAQNEVITRTTQMLKGNNDLIAQYQTMIDEMKKLYYGEGENNEGGLIGFMKAFKEEADAAKKAAEDAYDKIQEINKAQAEAAKKNTDEGSKANEPPTTPVSQPTAVPNSGGNNSGGGDGVPSIGDRVKFENGDYYANSYGGGNHYGYHHGEMATITYLNPKGSHPYHLNDWGWVKKSQISGYDTGGYTGEWGNSGRLAMLHQKELVLNRQDTANMLNAIEIMRGITDNIGADLLGRMAGMTAGGFNSSIANGTLDQNVHIEATFPGVTSSIEIQDALNNLVNMAAQRAQVK